jgi:hypothetical protein
MCAPKAQPVRVDVNSMDADEAACHLVPDVSRMLLYEHSGANPMISPSFTAHARIMQQCFKQTCSSYMEGHKCQCRMSLSPS